MTDHAIAQPGARSKSITARIHPATAVLGGVLVVAAAVLLYAGRHLTFYYDEWSFVLDRRGGSLGTYLDPHNGHLSLFPVIIYKLLFKLVGLRHYTFYRVVVVAFDLISAAVLYALAASRLGRWLALVPAVSLVLLGSAWQDLLWPFQIGYLGSIAAGLGTLLILDRGAPDRRREIAAVALLIYSVGSSAVGLAFLVAAAAMLAAQRAPWRRFWIIGVPAVLFAAWYVGWGTSEQVTGSSLLAAPQYIADAASAAFAGIAGLNSTYGTYGPPLAVAALAAIAFRVWRRRAPTPPLLAAAIAGALAFWGLSAVLRSLQGDPGASRYVYVGAVFILLAAAEAGTGVRLRGAGVALVSVLAAGALIGNLNQLRLGKNALETSDNRVAAALAATSIAAPVVTPTFLPTAYAPQIVAGSYLSAIRALGSPAPDIAGLEQSPPSLQAIADETLLRAEDIAIVPTAPTARPCAPAPLPTQLRVSGGQQLFIETRSTPTQIYLRRFAPTLSVAPVAPLAAHTISLVRFPADRAAAVPWNVMLAGAQTPLACVV